MDATITVPEMIYSDVAQRIKDTAEDNYDGTMTFCLLDEQFEDKAGMIYCISAAGCIYYTPTREVWGDDYWIRSVSFNYGSCEILDEDGEQIANDFDEYKLENYIC